MVYTLKYKISASTGAIGRFSLETTKGAKTAARITSIGFCRPIFFLTCSVCQLLEKTPEKPKGNLQNKALVSLNISGHKDAQYTTLVLIKHGIRKAWV